MKDFTCSSDATVCCAVLLIYILLYDSLPKFYYESVYLCYFWIFDFSANGVRFVFRHCCCSSTELYMLLLEIRKNLCDVSTELYNFKCIL